jgi:hypothetical protein
VLVPLDELARTTVFNYEILRETFAAQVQILEGTGAGTGTGTGAGTGTGTGTGTGAGAAGTTGGSGSGSSSTSSAQSGVDGGLSQGIHKLIETASREHEDISDRVRRIQARFEAQKERAENQLFFAVSKRAKVCRRHHLYHHSIA